MYYSRENLVDVRYSDGITHIGNSTLYGCKALLRANVPNGTNTIGKCAFEGCSSLTVIAIPDSLAPNGLGEYVFKNCTSLRMLTVPINVDLVGDNDDERFLGVCNIRSLLFTPGSGETAGMGHDYSGYSYQWSPQFFSRNSLSSAFFSEGVKKIGMNTFYGCYNLMSTSLPESLVTIDQQSFYGCSGLRGQLLIPLNVTEIKD